MKVELVAVNTPSIGNRDPRFLPILAIKTSVGKAHEKGYLHYLNREWNELWRKWIENAKVNFPSVLEHVTLTFFIDGISRVASHQLVRHRLVSFTQESQRYTEARIRKAFVKHVGFDPLKPKNEWTEAEKKKFEKIEKMMFNGSISQEVISLLEELYVFPESLSGKVITKYYFVVSTLVSTIYYIYLRHEGVPMEDARFALPQSIKTSLLATANLREWNHIIELRCDPKAQWEIRKVAKEIKRMIEEKLGKEFVVEKEC